VYVKHWKFHSTA